MKKIYALLICVLSVLLLAACSQADLSKDSSLKPVVLTLFLHTLYFKLKASCPDMHDMNFRLFSKILI